MKPAGHQTNDTGTTRLFERAIFALIVVAIGLRLFQLDRIPGINGDEVWSVNQMDRMLSGKGAAWFTPSGRLLSIPYCALVLLLHILLSPSFFVLRLPAAVSGILLVVFSFFLLKRVLPYMTALIATLCIASFPVNIAYSRVGWELSQVGLASLIAIFFSLKGSSLGTFLAFVAAMLVHPTNVFLFPLLLGPLLFITVKNPLWPAWKKSLLILATLLLPFFILVILHPLTSISLDTVLKHGVLTRLSHLDELPRFLLYYLRLLSGVTVYEDFSGPLSRGTALLFDLGFGLFLSIILVLGTIGLIRKRKLLELIFLAGLSVSILVLFAVAGDTVVIPGHERYALFLAVPSAIAISMLALEVCGNVQRKQKSILWGMPVFCAILIAGFVRFYFGVIRETGGLEHETYRTGPIEPKYAAFSWIVGNALSQGYTVNKRVTLIAKDWHIYWSIDYLTHNYPAITVRSLESFSSQQDFETFIKDARHIIYFVDFVNGSMGKMVKHLLPSNAIPIHTTHDYSGKGVLNIWRVPGL